MTNKFPKCITADVDGEHWQLLDSKGKQVQIGSSHCPRVGFGVRIIGGRLPTVFVPGGSVYTAERVMCAAEAFGFKWVKHEKNTI